MDVNPSVYENFSLTFSVCYLSLSLCLFSSLLFLLLNKVINAFYYFTDSLYTACCFFYIQYWIGFTKERKGNSVFIVRESE